MRTIWVTALGVLAVAAVPAGVDAKPKPQRQKIVRPSAPVARAAPEAATTPDRPLAPQKVRCPTVRVEAAPQVADAAGSRGCSRG